MCLCSNYNENPTSHHLLYNYWCWWSWCFWKHHCSVCSEHQYFWNLHDSNFSGKHAHVTWIRRTSFSYRGFIPLIKWPPDGRQPVDGDRTLAVVSDNWGQGNGGWMALCHPVLVDQVQVTVHPSHLVGSEMAGAVVIWRRVPTSATFQC